MAKNNQVKLRPLFSGLQRQMESALSLTREMIDHPSTMGDASEATWLKMLQGYLPKRYQAAKAIVLDSNENCSDQIDVVIFDRQYSPFLLNHEGALYVPAESVYAVFEAKQEISKDLLSYAADKAASVRRLHRTSAPIVQAGGNIDRPKPPPRIIAGILALDSAWNPPLGDACRATLNTLSGDRLLDMGCIIRGGTFHVLEKPCGDVHVEVRDRDAALVSFFLGLLQSLQRMGTVPAMDIAAYADRI